MYEELIQQAQELCGKATPGPWKAKTSLYPECNGEPWGWISGASLNITWSGNSGQVNAAFIAASRTLVPQLCDALEAETARAEKAEAERDAFKSALSRLERMVSNERDGNSKREHSVGVVVAVKRAREVLKGAK